MRWGAVARHTSPSGPGGGGGGGGGPAKEFSHAAAIAKGKTARQAREDQASRRNLHHRRAFLIDNQQ